MEREQPLDCGPGYSSACCRPWPSLCLIPLGWVQSAGIGCVGILVLSRAELIGKLLRRSLGGLQQRRASGWLLWSCAPGLPSCPVPRAAPLHPLMAAAIPWQGEAGFRGTTRSPTRLALVPVPCRLEAAPSAQVCTLSSGRLSHPEVLQEWRDFDLGPGSPSLEPADWSRLWNNVLNTCILYICREKSNFCLISLLSVKNLGSESPDVPGTGH